MSQRLVAVSFALLMFASTLPPAGATQHVEDLVPDVPTLPRARPTDECLPTGLQPQVFDRVNKLAAGDIGFYEDDVGVPALCGPAGKIAEWRLVIDSLNTALDALRNASAEIQRQVDGRLGDTLPESEYPNELVEPRTILLNETFNGRRTTGFGDWKVVTEKGEDPLFSIQVTEDVNGTRHAYRFGSDSGYARGAHQWLVSPEIDLTSLKGNRTAVEQLQRVRELARGSVYTTCNNQQLGVGTFICGEGADFQFIVDAYEQAIDDTVYTLPVMQHGAYLDMTYRHNFAAGVDGVRMWIYTGDRQPDRTVLFDPDLGRAAIADNCVHDASPLPAAREALNSTLRDDNEESETDLHDFSCTAVLDGGRVVRGMPGMAEASTFRQGAADARNATAFTADQPTFTTARLNLTPYMEKRVWILFEVKTQRNDRGTDIFNDPGSFTRFRDFGFELSRVYVEGDGYHRNFRLKDVGATFPYQQPENDHGDDPDAVRTTVPPGNDPIVMYVHNAGDYVENGTVTLTIYERSNRSHAFSTAPVGEWNTTVQLEPDEVRVLKVPWSVALKDGQTLRENYLYRLNASLTQPPITYLNGTKVGDQLDDVGNGTPPLLDPNATSVQPPNAAGLPLGAGQLSLSQDVRAARILNLSVQRADGVIGTAIQVCSSILGRACEEHPAGKKGEPRIILVGIRNEGNAPQDATAILTLELDGVAKPDAIVGGPARELRDLLPGEVRPVEWTVIPSEPGAYRITVSTIRDGATGSIDPNAERRLFVQRSTGLICLDTLVERECGPRFGGQLVPLLRDENITATALAPDGTLVVATNMSYEVDGVHHGQLAARDPATGEWRILQNLSRSLLNETLQAQPLEGTDYGPIRDIVVAPDGSLLLVGDNSTVLLWRTTGTLARIPVLAEPANLTSAIWYKDTLLAAGDNGTLLHLSNGSMHRIVVQNTSLAGGVRALRPFEGTIHALGIAPNGHGVLVGDGGTLLRHDPKNDVTKGWIEIEVGGKPLAWTIGRHDGDDELGATDYNATLRSIHVHDDRLVVGGAEGVLLASETKSKVFTLRNMTAPPRVLREDPFVRIFTSHLGGLHVLDAGGNLATCDDCFSPLAQWHFPALSRPTVLAHGPAHPAAISHVEAGPTGTFLAGEAGLVMGLDVAGDYENLHAWTTMPALAARDGGVIQTYRGYSGDQFGNQYGEAFLGMPDEDGRSVANKATKFRLFLNHSVRSASPTEQGEIRLLYRPLFDARPASTVSAETETCPRADDGDPVGSTLDTACNDKNVRYVIDAFAAPTKTDGWEFRAYDHLPTAPVVPGGLGGDAPPASLYLWALEIYVPPRDVNGVFWAIDDIRLQGQLSDGQWHDIVSWNGPAEGASRGDWFISDLHGNLLVPVGQAHAVPSDQLDHDQPQWEIWPFTFDLETFSPWHVTTQYADRPVFAANNEFYKAGYSNPTHPRLLQDWDSRLVSPIIDLTDAYDPVVQFRHTYAFRTQFVANPQESDSTYKAGDGGILEIQYQLRGEECGSVDPSVTCGWSRFYVVRPDAGYPGADRFGLSKWKNLSSAATTEKDRIGNGVSYWNRIALPDETGAISTPRLTEKYVTERVWLDNVTCTATELDKMEKGERVDCVPTNLTGRQIRFAFRILTGGDLTRIDRDAGTTEISSIWNLSFADAPSNPIPVSFPGEGWYITDFKVLGARTLGIDLRASNLSFRVGYDVNEIGVGPGTRVPVNVTVENRGTFEALGYTGRLEVYRVLDRALQTTRLVDTVHLSQQPVLDPETKRNHTIYWTVPGAEGAEYSLRFVLEPVGIDRDEDFLDNVAELGTLAQPIPAKTVRRFHTEFLVSPENATIDITRYMPMFINNTGNVPLEEFTVERRISAIGRVVADDAKTCEEWEARIARGLRSAIVDCREWTTQRPAPAGERTPLTAISDEVSPTTDLFWKAPERASFLVTLAAQTHVGSALLSSAADTRVSAFATYLFDDVEGGPRGESQSGAWVPGPGWNVTQPGFRSTEAYGFGDPALGRYAPDANTGIVSPRIDISSARIAEVAFYHDFKFEPGFDGGLIEASVDGGATWTPIVPRADALISTGYNLSHPVQPSSVLHPSGDPEDSAYAFTADSRLLPSSVDGWTLTQLDLTDFAGVTEQSVPYELYTGEHIAGYSAPSTTPVAAHNLYSAADWCPGRPEDDRCWLVENVTQGMRSPARVVPGVNEETFWWSGSASIHDDQRAPITNYIMLFDVDLSGVAGDDVVVAEWWEYAARYRGVALFKPGGEAPRLPSKDISLGVHSFHPYSPHAATYRYNLSEPKIVEQQGKWFRMQADLTPYVKGRDQLQVGFAYTPVSAESNLYSAGMTEEQIRIAEANAPTADGTTYGIHYRDDLGFAIDNLTIKAARVVRGQPLGEPKVLFSEASEEWAQPDVYACDANDAASNSWLTDTAYAACFNDANAGYVFQQPIPALRVPGRSWALVPEMPGAGNASWRAVSVLDHNAHTPARLPPTGHVPTAWWTGDTQCIDASKTCPKPNSEGRLITPAIDLGRIAGSTAEFTFWHRYAFQDKRADPRAYNLSSGGVVEISVYEPQTDTWTPWEQIYSQPGNLTLGPSSPAIPARGHFRGGYTGFTANTSESSDGVRRFDPPFHNVIPTGEGDPRKPVQFLYTGNSTKIEESLPRPDGHVDGWMQERFDVSEHIGKRVRFAFHYAFSPDAEQDAWDLDNPHALDADTKDMNADQRDLNDRGGWWVTDVGIVGDVLVGKPMQLRFRAGSDGNVQDGHWKIDDLGAFGARYKNNVGVFVDSTPGLYGAYANSTTVIPVTIRNMGDSVRRDLALEITNARSDQVALEISGDAPGGSSVIPRGTGSALVLEGFTLGAGQSVTVDIRVKTPATLGELNKTELLVRLKERNPLSTTEPFGNIVDNEVYGLLSRVVDFGLQRQANVTFPSAYIPQASPNLGEPVDMVLTAFNPGYGPATLNLSCAAETITGYHPADHNDGPEERPVVAATYGCELVAGSLTLQAKEWTNLTYRATPTEAGFLRFTVKGNVVDGVNITEDLRAGVAVGVSPFVFRTGFDRPEDLRNFSINPSQDAWAYLRGHDRPGALLIGINETRAGDASYSCGGVPCKAESLPVDLHNFSERTPAFLSFWHQDRFAKHDGAQVRARVLLNEQRPGSVGNEGAAWSKQCVLRPVGGYEGRISQIPPVPATDQNADAPAGDPNPLFQTATIYPPGAPGIRQSTDVDFFVSPGGQWEEGWSLAVFDLTQPCQRVDGLGDFSLVGRTVRFDFELYAGGNPSGELRRGAGHGWLIDDIAVGPLGILVRPDASQRATLLDNTTKAFHVVVENLGSTPDVVRLEFDALNSSAPEGSVTVPDEAIPLAPGGSRTVAVKVTLPRDPSLLPTDFKARIVAQSLRDKNAAGATTLELAFAPRQWPELVLAVEPPAGIVQEGTEAFVPITIENIGLVDSVASRVRIVDEWAGGRVEHSLDLSGMPSVQQAPEEATRVLEFRWRPEKGSVGAHTLTFEVDPDVLGEEYTRTNNLVQLVVPVSDLLIPDLHVANLSALTLRNAVGGVVTPGRDADVARFEVTAGELVSFELKVRNDGRAGATNVDVRAFIGELSLPPKTIPYIAPGTEVVVTFNWLAQKGEHEIEFLVRSEQVELSTANNRYPGVGVTFLTVKGYEVEVEIPALDGLLEPGTEVAFPFRISNSGNAGEDLELRVKTPSGMRAMLPREGFFLRAGETYEAEARLILEAEAVAGEQFITIEAVARENPMKVATGRAAARVNASYGGNVVGGYTLGAPPDLVLPIQIVNEGNSLEPWTVMVQLPAGWVAKEKLPARVIVPAHDSATFQLHVSVPETTAPGDRVVAIQATMPNGEKREGTVRVGVQPLRAAAVQISDRAPTPDRGELTIPVTVENTGNVKQPFELLLVDAPAGIQVKVEPASFDLPPGGKAVAQLRVVPNASVQAGTYSITGYTRFEGVVPQTQEGLANVQTLRVPIVRQDLALGELEYAPRAGLDAGDRVTVRVPVHNRGLTDLADVPVHLFVDDVFIEEARIPALAAGARLDVTFNWTAVTGVHTLTVVVDPYEDTVDADRADNAASTLATIGVDVPTGGIAAGRADTPAPGLFGLLAALAAALLVTRGNGSRRQRR